MNERRGGKCLIIYSSFTGNTEKVANTIEKVFNKNGWETDVFKIRKGFNVRDPPFRFEDYDFLCAGSLVMYGLPAQEVVDVIRLKSREIGLRKVVPGPKRGIVFATYGGAHLGPKEAGPCLAMLESETEHLKFKCVGIVTAPGRYVRVPGPTPEWYHGDLTHRPDENDMERIADCVNRILNSKEDIDDPIVCHSD